jgi:hypothetical protein
MLLKKQLMNYNNNNNVLNWKFSADCSAELVPEVHVNSNK